MVVANSKIFWNFHPDFFGEDEPIFDEHIFQRGLGWNHQLEMVEIVLGVVEHQSVGKEHVSNEKKLCLAILLVSFLGWWKRDLQRSGIKRSQIESPGGCLGYIGD